MRCRTALVFTSLLAAAIAQGPPAEGPRPIDARWYALTGARIVEAPGRVHERATLVLRDGVVTALGDAPPPAGATVLDCTGLVLFPAFVEPFHPSDVPALDPQTQDQHWNPMVQPQRRAQDGALVAEKDREALRALGYAAVAVAPSGGVLKGTAALVQLDEPTPQAPVRVLRDRVYALASLQTGGGYPSSEMGAIALLRQSLYDGEWFERCRRAVEADPSLANAAPPPSGVLQALADQRRLPLWFDVQDELQALRVHDLAVEFERDAVLVGSGMEFRRTAALALTRRPLVVPLQWPDAPDVGTAAAAERVSLRQLQSWEQAPTNSKRLLDAGLQVAWTTARLRERKDFAARAREAIACGVTAEQALAAVTTVPAGLLGVADRLGTLAVGKLANVVVATGDPFGERTEIRDVFVGGVRHVVNAAKDAGLDGTWSWSEGWPGSGAAPSLVIAGDAVTAKAGETKYEIANVQRDARSLTCRVQGKELGDGVFLLRLHRDGDGLSGVLTRPDGQALAMRAARGEATAAAAKPDGDAAKFTPPALAALPTPLGGYGFVAEPAPQEFAIVGATLWTSDGRGNVRDGALHVRDGKIVYAGPRSELPRLPEAVRVIDGTGKHVTPGLIDCHSHTGIARGVNEGGQAVTAEVRIEDVLDPDDVNWYRQLAGGVTTVNQLHGSANAIGGQSRTTKIRWGVHQPRAMHFAGATAGMKWALGENPRQVNGNGSSRYPQTRMGVEALLRDRFAAATVYAREHASYRALTPPQRAKVLPPRRDLELEAIGEILAGTRWIHCHSYRQDEILMLCGLAREHGLRIGTFQHVLEGYKVADAIAANARGASSFTDWWAYKFEVYDAIPDNGAILHEAGVVTSFNSDSDELARRLNTEAGKAVKYGGLAPADALCFVTKNPALQLGVFERTGSLTAGKDADVVLWTDDPLGYAARAEATWVDGVQRFALATDAQNRAAIAKERARLLQKALTSGAKGRTARERDPKDAYWAAEDLTADYCCRTGGDR